MLPDINRGRGIRTPMNGFGDRHTAVVWLPFIQFKLIFLYNNRAKYFRIRSICLQNYTLKISFHLSHIFFPDLPSGHALDRLVTVSSMHHCTSTSALSTSSSSRGLTSLCYGKSYLEGGFTLRCLQRLSLPNLATLPWYWLPTDTPEASPSRSSRTKDSSSQISYAHAG